MKKIRQFFINMQLIKFIIIGGINTVSGTGFALLLMRFLQTNIAFIIGYMLSLMLAYLLNTYFVFRYPLSLERCLRFFLSYVPNFIINNTIVIIVYNVLGFHKYAAIVCSAVIGLPISFLCVKLFAFNENDKRRS